MATTKDTKEFFERADRMWHRVPTFNVLQIRWFENLLDVYKDDVQEISRALANDPQDTTLQKALVKAVTFVETLEYQLQMISDKE